jgi:hypothetical protein
MAIRVSTYDVVSSATRVETLRWSVWDAGRLGCQLRRVVASGMIDGASEWQQSIRGEEYDTAIHKTMDSG